MFGTFGSKVPPAIDFRASIGGVSAKSEMCRRFPIAMPMTMLTTTKIGSNRKSSRRIEQGLHRIGLQERRACVAMT